MLAGTILIAFWLGARFGRDAAACLAGRPADPVWRLLCALLGPDGYLRTLCAGRRGLSAVYGPGAGAATARGATMALVPGGCVGGPGASDPRRWSAAADRRLDRVVVALGQAWHLDTAPAGLRHHDMGYLLVMAPWFARNLTAVGTPLPVGGTRASGSPSTTTCFVIPPGPMRKAFSPMAWGCCSNRAGRR